jgi:RNA polymerase sigma-70 factor (ECF subfamily)
MSDDESFRTFLLRVRSGDAQAAAELVKLYEPEIRRAVRVRLRNPAMGQLFDSMDICNSVLANFFARAAAGQFALEQPEQLVGLLVAMARNKLRDLARKQTATKRGGGLQANPAAVLNAVAADDSTPSQVVAGQELLQELRRRLSPEEQFLAEQWSQGRGWAEIAAAVGGRPDAVRRRLSRAIRRVANELGLDEVDDG